MLLLFFQPFLILGQQIHFSEKFDDNSHQWIISEEGSVKTKIQSSKYYVERSSPKGASLLQNDLIELTDDDDFSFTTHLNHLSGNEIYGYGIFFGGLDFRNFYAVTISADRSFSFYKFEDGAYFSIESKQGLDDIIKDSGNLNEIKVLKQNHKLNVFINEHLVYSGEFQSFFGKNTGVIVNADMKVSFDDMLILRGVQDKNFVVQAPQITWISPEEKVLNVNYSKFNIEVGISSLSQLKYVDLYQNHALIKKFNGFSNFRSDMKLEFDEIISYEIDLLVGMNEIKLVAVNEDGEQTVSTRAIQVSNLLETPRKDYAILIATNEYDEWSNLVNPVFDAKTIGKELSERYGMEVEILTNANTSDIMSKLKFYAQKKYEPKDQLFVFFAGHGKYDKDFGEGYVVCKNSKIEDLGNTSLLSHSTLRTVINNIPCDHIFLTMDVCFGGTFDQSLGSGKHRGLQNDVYNELSRREFINHKLAYRTRKYITSGGNEYVPDGIAGNHSPFARKIIEALRSGGGEDGILTLAELMHFLERVQPEPRNGEFGSNEPGSEFLFIRK